MNGRKLKWWVVGFVLGQAAILRYKDKNLQKKVAKAPTFWQKAKAFFDGRVGANKEIIDDVKNFDYEGTWDEVKALFQKEIKLVETKLVEFEDKIAEWKDKANDIAHKKAEEISANIEDHINNMQTKLQGKWDDINEKYEIEEKVKLLHKHYTQLKTQLNK